MITHAKVLNFKNYGVTINGDTAYIKMIIKSEPMPNKPSRIECKDNKNETLYQYYERLIYAAMIKSENIMRIINDSAKIKTLSMYNPNLVNVIKKATKSIDVIHNIDNIITIKYLDIEEYALSKYCNKLKMCISDLNRFNTEYTKAENSYIKNTEIRTKYISKNLLDVLKTAKLTKCGYSTESGIIIRKRDIETILKNCSNVLSDKIIQVTTTIE